MTPQIVKSVVGKESPPYAVTVERRLCRRNRRGPLR